MTRKVESRKIDDVEVTVTQFPALEGGDAFATTLAKLAPVLAIAPEIITGKLNLAQLDLSTFLGALGELCKQLAGTGLSELARMLLRGSIAVVQGDDGNGRKHDLSKPGGFAAFDGRGFAMLQAMMFSAEVNFAHFFPSSSLGTGGTPLAAKASSPST